MVDELDTSIDLATGRPIDQYCDPGIKGTILNWIIGIVVVAVLTTIVLPATIGRSRSRRLPISHLNLRQIGMALHSYHGIYESLPPAFTVDARGKPLHSWRTLILPYLGKPELVGLYSRIDFSKPWNDPRNAEAYNTELSVYHNPETKCEPTCTTYLGIATPHGCFPTKKTVRFSDVTDGLSNTLGVIEVDADHAVHWMAPLDADESTVLGIGADIKRPGQEGMFAFRLDGVVMCLDKTTSVEDRLAWISIAGNDRVTSE